MRSLIAILACLAVPALAQEDDLAPLAPLAKPKPKPPAAKPKPRPVVAKPPLAKPKPAPVADDDLAPLSFARGELVVKVLPATVTNAVLLVDGKELGTAPSTQSLSPGEHTVTIKRPGYSNFVKKVTVAVGKSVELDAKLNAVQAVLTVSSDVPDAQVLINNKLIGTTPIAEREWPAGTYEITIRKEGFKEDKQSVTFVAGRDYPISVKFKPPVTTTVAALPTTSDRPLDTSLTPTAMNDSPLAVVTPATTETPLYQRWYFWAGIVAVVAAGVGIGVAVNQAGAKPRPLAYKDFCVNGVCPTACINLATCSAVYATPGGGGITF